MRTFRFVLATVLAAAGLSVVVAQPAAYAAGTVTTFDQCDRGTPATSCSGWITGNLNGGYSEDQVVPQRAVLNITSPGETEFAFSYQDLLGANNHAIDFLATWNYTQTTANPCQGIAALCGGTPSKHLIPSDTATRGTTAGGYSNIVADHEFTDPEDRQLYLYGGATITDASITHNASEGILTVKVNAASTGPQVLLFGAHLALTGPNTNPRAWQNGASTNNGTIQFKVVTGGAQTHPMKVGPGATPPPPPAAFSITKSVNPTTAAPGQQVEYTVTVSNTGGQAGSTTFTDDYNNNLTAVGTPAGCTQGAGQMSCTTNSILPGGSQVFTYTANMPASFSGGAGTGGCPGGQYPVTNTATLANAASANARVCVTAAPQISVTKTADDETPDAGQSVTYTITVTNNGNAVGSTTVTDTFDTPPTPASALALIDQGCTVGTSSFSCPTGDLAAGGGTKVYTYTSVMPASFSSGTTCTGGYVVGNTAALSTGGSASANVCVQAAPAFAITKDVSDSIAVPGQTVTYTVTVKNTGSAPGSTTVTDDYDNRLDPSVPDGCTDDGDELTCATGTLAPGAEVSFQYTATMPASFTGPSGTGGCATGSYPVGNTATLAAGASASKTVCVGAGADFTITKTADPASAIPGQTVTYTVEVKNTGTADGGSSFTDDYDDRLSPSVPNGCTDDGDELSCTTGVIDAGQTATFTYTAVMPATFGPDSGDGGCALGSYSVANTATLASGPSDDAEVCVQAAPAFEVAKTSDVNGTAAPGQVVTWTVTVKNSGTAAGSTSFTDDYDDRLVTSVPAGCEVEGGTLECTTGVIAAGGEKEFTYSATLPNSFTGSPGGGTCSPTTYRVGNSVELQNTDGDSVDVCVAAAPSFLIDKTVSNESPAPGEEVTYQITVTNNGTASGATSFTDDYDDRLSPSVPDGCADDGDVLTCTTDTIDSLDDQVFTYTATMPATFTGPGGGGSCEPGSYRVANTATLTGGAADTAVACVAAAPDFEVSKEASTSTAGVGETVTYTIIVTNNGPAAGSTTVTDDHDDRVTVTAPAGCTDDGDVLTCTTGDIASGDSETITYDAVMPATFTGGEHGDCGDGAFLISNGVTVDGDEASADVCVAAAPAFEVTKDSDVDEATTGGEVEYTITVTNTGTAPGSTTLTDVFDSNVAGVTAMASDPAGNDCAAELVLPNTFVCGTAVLNPGDSQTFTYTATMPATFPTDHEAGQNGCTAGQHDVHNAVSVSGDSAQATVCVDAAPAFEISKTASDTVVQPGAEVTYTVTVTNTGTAAGSPSFIDTSGATITSTPANCDLTDDVLTCSGPLLGAGESHDYTYTADMPETFTGDPDGEACEPPAYPVVNTAALSGGETAEETVCVGAGPDLVLSKSVDEENPALGSTVTYTVTVTNEGTAPGSMSFTDDYDDRLTLSNVPAGCTDDGDVLECTTGSIAAGDAESFEYDATLPESVSGDDGGGACGPGTYRFTNSVTSVGGESAAQDICVAASPEFTIAKEVDEASVEAGTGVTYTITVTNSGTASGSTGFTDDYDDRIVPEEVTSDPEGGSCSDQGGSLSCTTSTILAGESQTFTYSASMPASFDADDEKDGDCYPVTNRASIGDQHSDATVCVNAEPDFAISKSAGTETAAPGQDVEYTVTVTNNGTANGSTTFTDDYADGVTVTVPDGCTDDGDVLTCETGDLAPLGGSQDFTYTGTMPATFGADAPQGDCGEGSYAIDNTATLEGGDASDGATVCVDASAQFSIEKSAEPVDALPGGTVTYTITVTNNGTAAGSTGFTDDYDDRLTPTVPDGCTDESGSFSCTTGSIPAGESETFEYDAVLPATYGTNDGAEGCEPGTFRVRNSAALDDGPADSATVCVTASPSVAIDKDVDDENAVPGQTVRYTITVSNSGDAASPPVTFTDDYADGLTDLTLTDGCTAGSGSFTCTTEVIPAGGEQVFTYEGTLPEAFDGGEGDGDCDPGTYPVANDVTNGDEGPADSVLICSPAAPEFDVLKSVDAAHVEPGATVTYTVVVENNGNASGATSFVDDYDALLDPTAPEGCVKVLGTLSCTTGTIQAGESQTFTYSATVPETFTGEPGGGDCSDGEYRITNGITETSGAVAGQDVCVAAAPEFTVTKSVNEPVAQPGQTVTYTVTVANTGSAAGSTTIVDDYDDRLSDVTVPDGCVADVDASALTCTTGELLAGAEQAFTYDATLPSTFSGESGLEPCAPGEYGVANLVLIGEETVASYTVCVPAGPEFDVVKTADPTSAAPDQTVTYTVTVTNTGEVAGSTSFVDDHDDRVTPSVPEGCEAGDGVLECTTGTIEPGDAQEFTYTATMPATFTGPSGTNGCPSGSYGVLNTVALAGGEGTSSAPICVAASPNVSITKSDALDVEDDGDQTITYTIDYKNTGAAEALDVVVSDPIPSGTAFVSCTGGCTVVNGTATWPATAVAPAGGTGSVTLVVKVTSNQTCVINNTAQIKVGAAPAVSSNTVTTPVTPAPDTANAKSHGSAIGLSVQTNGLLNLIGPLINALFTNNNTMTLSNASSSKTGPGAPSISSDQVLSVRIPNNGSLLRTGVISTTSMSTVTAAPAETRNTSVSEVAGVCLVPVAGVCTVEASAVRAVASTMANGGFAAVSTAGSTITNLKVVNTVVPVDLNTSVTIPLPAAVFGKNSYVAINEKTGTAGLKGGKYVADQSVAMIHVKITGLLLGVQAAEIYVAKATAHSEFPKTFVCQQAKTQSVSGHAFLARLYAGWILDNDNLTVGYAQISPLGGAEDEQVLDVKIPRYGVIADAQVGDTHSAGGFTGSTSAAQSWAEVAGDGDDPLCVLSYVIDCVVKATAIRSEARSVATAAGSTSTDLGTNFVGLKVLGIPISGTPRPNTVIPLPGIGFVILNEQFCDNGTYASGACSGPTHSGLTVRAVRIVITVANNLLGLSPGVELVLSEAHADSTFS